MSKISLYINEDAIDADFVQALRSRHVNVLTVADVGMLHCSDNEQLDWARENDRVIFSFNTRDFYQLHTQLIEKSLFHAGMILAPQQRYGIGELMRRVLRLIDTKTAEEMQGQVEFLSNWNPQKILPFHLCHHNLNYSRSYLQQLVAHGSQATLANGNLPIAFKYTQPNIERSNDQARRRQFRCASLPSECSALLAVLHIARYSPVFICLYNILNSWSLICVKWKMYFLIKK